MDFDVEAEQFDSRAGIEPGVGREIARAIVDIGCRTADAIVLDIGAGTGSIGGHFSALPVRYVGMDLSASMLRVFQEKRLDAGGRLLLLQANCNRPWPIRRSAAAVVFASRVVHLLNADYVVSETLRVCRPGGSLLMGRVRRDPQSLKSRLQQQKRALLAEQGIATADSASSVQHIIEQCATRGATPIKSRTVAKWSRTTTARRVISSWATRPTLSHSVNVERLAGEARAAVFHALEGWARREFEDLDRPCTYTERYMLEGVRLP